MGREAMQLRLELLGIAALALCTLCGGRGAVPWHGNAVQASARALELPARSHIPATHLFGAAVGRLRGGAQDGDTDEGPGNKETPAPTEEGEEKQLAVGNETEGEAGGTGAEMGWFDPLHELGEGGLLPGDGGVNVTLLSRGIGWRRPPMGSQVLGLRI